MKIMKHAISTYISMFRRFGKDALQMPDYTFTKQYKEHDKVNFLCCIHSFCVIFKDADVTGINCNFAKEKEACFEFFMHYKVYQVE